MKLLHLFLALVLVACFVTCQSYRNSVLRAVAISQPPFVFIDNSKTGNDRFEGFYVDLLNEVLKKLNANITYTLYEVPDKTFGSLVNGTWTGIIGELNNSRADIAFSPLTITSQRVTAIDFSSPYLDIGLRIAVLNQPAETNLFAFLSPFSYEVWLLMIAATLAVAFICWLLDRMSPFGFSKLPEDDDDKTSFSFNESLLNSTMISVGQDSNPGRSWSTRIIVLGFCFFMTIVSSTYTANLASILTAKKENDRLTSLNDIRTKGFKFSCVRNSAPSAFFESNPLVSDIKKLMVLYPSYDLALEAVRKKEVEAIVWPNIIIEYTSNQQPCDTLQVGDLFNKGNYGIPLPKNSALLGPMSQAILSLREEGIVDILYKKWWFDRGACSSIAKSESGSVKIGDLGGVFLFLVMTIGLGVFVLVFEILFSLVFRKTGLHKIKHLRHLDNFMGRTPAQDTKEEATPSASANSTNN